MTHIGALIKKYRCESGMTQRDLAAGLSLLESGPAVEKKNKDSKTEHRILLDESEHDKY